MNNYINDVKSFLKNKKYLAMILIVALLSYGFAMTQVTVGIDDLEVDRYIGSGQEMLRAGRFGVVMWKFLRTQWANFYSVEFMAVVLLLLAVISFSILYRRVSGGQISMEACTVFSGVLISYPLINEIWEYSGGGMNVCGGYLLAALAVLMVHSFLHGGKRRYILLPIAVFFTMWICSAYESLASVYVFTVCSVLALQVIYGPEKEKHLSQILLQGMVYAAILAAGLLLRVVVHGAILAIMHLEPGTNGATVIQWGTVPGTEILKGLLFGFLRSYVLKGLIYFPLGELLVAVVVFVGIGLCACRKHSWALLLPGAGMLLSLILLSLLQGSVSPYRTCQVFGSFVAFTAMVVVICIQQADWKHLRWIPGAVCTLGCILSFYQAIYLNNFLFANHLRSEEEAFVVRDVGTDLQAENPQNKPVIFVGKYPISSAILESVSVPPDSKAWSRYCTWYDHFAYYLGEDFYPENFFQYDRKLPETNVNSVLSWSLLAFSQDSTRKIFAYYGMEYTPVAYEIFNDTYTQANTYAREHDMPSYPQNGYIADVGEYLIVRLGEDLWEYRP